MKRLGYAIAAVALLLDQLTKYWVTAVLDLPSRSVVAVLPFFDLMWVGNPGVSMSLLRAQNDVQKCCSSPRRWRLLAGLRGGSPASATASMSRRSG